MFIVLWMYNFVVTALLQNGSSSKGTSIDDVRRFFEIFDLPSLINPEMFDFLGHFEPPLPTLKLDVINGRSPSSSLPPSFFSVKGREQNGKSL